MHNKMVKLIAQLCHAMQQKQVNNPNIS